MKMIKISICQQDELESGVLKKEFDEDYPNNIYFIILRSKVTLVPSKCKFKFPDPNHKTYTECYGP